MRVFKTKTFRRFQRKEGISDADLSQALQRAADGLIDGDLGHGLIKQRVARQGAGRRSGFRTIIAYHVGRRAVFVYGFAKSTQENISAADLRDLADTGALLLRLDADGIERLIVEGELWEVEHGEEE